MFEIALVFVLIILFLVVSHELGHFLVAKWFGVRVEEFGVGIPPRVFGIRKGETLYSLNLLPIGGFVRIFGEEKDIEDPRSFSSQSYTRRALIVVAGVAANVLVAFIIFSIIAGIGVASVGVLVQGVAENSPAGVAGIVAGDLIVGLGEDSETLPTVTSIQNYIGENSGSTILIHVVSEGAAVEREVIPRIDPPEGEGAIGVIIADTGIEPVPLYRVPLEGIKTTWFGLKAIVQGIILVVSSFFSEGASEGDLIGPVGIAVIARETFSIGLVSFFQLIAFLSLHLAVINIIPIPALDGGRLFFFGIEKVTGRQIPTKIASVIHSIFFVLLVLLLIWITHRDITNWDRYLEVFSRGGV